MPAIQPARLKKQTVELAGHFLEPERFVRALHDLLDYYADRTRRPGQSGSPAPLLPGYEVPRPVMRQILRELEPKLDANPQETLKLADALWREPFMEPRLLAVRILSQLAPGRVQGVQPRLVRWIVATEEETLLQALVGEGFQRLRREHPDRFLSLARSWLINDNPTLQSIGLRALRPLVLDSDFNNLPAIFRLIQVHVHRAETDLRPDLLELVQALAKRSPRETAYFLRRSLDGALDEGTARLVRRCLDFFPEENQRGLRQALRE